MTSGANVQFFVLIRALRGRNASNRKGLAVMRNVWIAGIVLVAMAGAWAGNDTAGDETNAQARAQVQHYMTGPSVFVHNPGQLTAASIKYALDGMGLSPLSARERPTRTETSPDETTPRPQTYGLKPKACNPRRKFDGCEIDR